MSSKLNLLPPNTSNDYDFNEEDFRTNLPLMSSDKLCEIIVCHRYLGLMQTEAFLAMEELAGRREKGDVFDFEGKIELLGKDLPVIDLDLNKILKSFRF